MLHKTLISLLMLACIIFFMTGMFEKQYHFGKISDHFDGKKFHNIEPYENNTFDFIKWKLTRKNPEWPEWVNSEYGPKPAERIENDQIKITLINHNSFLIQTQGYNILTDPIYAEKVGPYELGPKRVRNPGIKFEDLPKIDIVLITHNHYDHLDIPTIKMLNDKFSPFFITPLGVARSYLVEEIKDIRYQELDWWQEDLFKNLKIALVPAHHWSRRHIYDKNSTLWGGYVIKTGDKNIYYVGDTGFANGEIFKLIKKEFGEFEVALIPIGSYQPRWFMQNSHINPEEAVKIYEIISPKYAAAMHYHTFELADDKYNEPINDLKESLANKNISQDKFKLLEFGHPWEVK